MTNAANMATTLRRLRDKEGLTQQDLAIRAGVSRATIQNMEQGKPPKRPDIYRKVADYFGVSIEQIRGLRTRDSGSSEIDRLLDEAYDLAKRWNLPVEQVIADMAAGIRKNTQRN